MRWKLAVQVNSLRPIYEMNNTQIARTHVSLARLICSPIISTLSFYSPPVGRQKVCLAIIQYNQIMWNILNTGKHRKYHITNKLLHFEMKPHRCWLEVLASTPSMLATLMPQRKRLIYAMTNKHYRRNGFGSMNHKVLNCQFNIQTAGRQIIGDLSVLSIGVLPEHVLNWQP